MISNNDIARSLNELIKQYLGIEVKKQGVVTKLKQKINNKELEFRTDKSQRVHKSFTRHR